MAAERTLFAARSSGVIAGCAGHKADRLRHVYVDPAFLRQGIGSALLHHTEHHFRTVTAHQIIRAGVALHAQPFYLANGYLLDRLSTAWDGSTYAEMHKPLTRDAR
jgi:GNAT superfamily N-acetyltransferase